jgi:hypothetical protein
VDSELEYKVFPLRYVATFLAGGEVPVGSIRHSGFKESECVRISDVLQEEFGSGEYSEKIFNLLRACEEILFAYQKHMTIHDLIMFKNDNGQIFVGWGKMSPSVEVDMIDPTFKYKNIKHRKLLSSDYGNIFGFNLISDINDETLRKINRNMHRVYKLSGLECPMEGINPRLGVDEDYVNQFLKDDNTALYAYMERTVNRLGYQETLKAQFLASMGNIYNWVCKTRFTAEALKSMKLSGLRSLGFSRCPLNIFGGWNVSSDRDVIEIPAEAFGSLEYEMRKVGLGDL